MQYYMVPQAKAIKLHFPGTTKFLSDVDEDKFDSNEEWNELLLKARIRSGDYFSTLATEIEKLGGYLEAKKFPEADQLHHIVDELLYIDKHYDLKKR